MGFRTLVALLLVYLATACGTTQIQLRDGRVIRTEEALRVAEDRVRVTLETGESLRLNLRDVEEVRFRGRPWVLAGAGVLSAATVAFAGSLAAFSSCGGDFCVLGAAVGVPITAVLISVGVAMIIPGRVMAKRARRAWTLGFAPSRRGGAGQLRLEF